jgi:polysaccharide deacetylase family protein (PEP-CTERM system associated)
MRVLSFDIEEWFHLLDHPETRSEAQWKTFEVRFEQNLERVLSIVSRCNVKATFFCLGWVAEQYPHLIRKICDAGYEVACHSSRHQLAYQQTPDEFRADFCSARDAISDATGMVVDTYRIPGFSLTQESIWALDILGEEGVEVDCSVFPAVRGHGGLPQFKSAEPCVVRTGQGHTLKELPLNTRSILGSKVVFSGGGYFRLFPYWLLKKLFTDSEYVMTYFHPRDFDADQPMIPNLSASRRFKSYVGLKGAEAKLVKLLNDFEFVDVRTAVSQVDWDTAPVVQV